MESLEQSFDRMNSNSMSIIMIESKYLYRSLFIQGKLSLPSALRGICAMASSHLVLAASEIVRDLFIDGSIIAG